MTTANASLHQKWMFLLSGMCVASYLAGCTTIPKNISEQVNNHLVMVDHDGNLLDYTNGSYKTSPHPEEHTHQTVEAIRTSGYTNIVIFVQGGLNKLDKGVERAVELPSQIMTNGFYPVFIDWNSDMVSAYGEHLGRIRHGRKPFAAPVTAPLYFVADLGRAALRLPVVWFALLTESDWQGVTRSLTKSAYINTNDCPAEYNWTHWEISNVNAMFCAYHDEMVNNQTNAFKLSMGGFHTTPSSRLGNDALLVATQPTKMLVAPFLDAVGQQGWENMRRRTQTMFRKYEEFDIHDRIHEKDTVVVSEVAKSVTMTNATGAVSGFLDALQEMIGQNTNIPFNITLVGHSMGAIVANEVIRTHPNLPFSNIVYMAAACSVRDMERVVVPYLQTKTNACFYNLCLHPQNDFSEGVGVRDLYLIRGSLLEWIDNYASNPADKEDRTLGKWENIMQGAHVIPPSIRPRVTLKAFGYGDPCLEGPQNHGDFSRTKFWNSNVWQASTGWTNIWWQSSKCK